MKRFYADAAAEAVEGGWQVVLDGRPVRTPARSLHVVPTRALGEAIAAEWRAQGDRVDPRSMPLTGLANAAIDRVAPDREAFAAGLAQYGESDLLCYRADTPAKLVLLQAEAWDPVLAWARRRYDVEFEITTGVIHRRQPQDAVDRLARAVRSRSPFELAALSPLVTIGGSLILALALVEGAMSADAAWAAATVEDRWQAEQWGEDAEAKAALDNRQREFGAAHHFLALLG